MQQRNEQKCVWLVSVQDGRTAMYLCAKYRRIRVVVLEVLLYVHRNRSFIRDGSPGRPPRLSPAPELCV